MSIAEVAATGDRRATLEALRDSLARQLDGGNGAVGQAALALRLESVLAAIAELPIAGEATPLDDVAAARARRIAAAGLPARAAGPRQ